MTRKRVLIFPCGSEIGIELQRALATSRHFEPVGATSTPDRGEVFFPSPLRVPFVNDSGFVDALRALIRNHAIDFLYPAMDSVLFEASAERARLPCAVVAPEHETVAVCHSKTRTYETLRGVVATPRQFRSAAEVEEFPVYLKPDVGYGTRRNLTAVSAEQVADHLAQHPDSIILEYLPGQEYTVDCFTSGDGRLRYVEPRERAHIINGISGHAAPFTEDRGEFETIAARIGGALSFRGAWFFQVRRRAGGELTLLEVACRVAGSSGVNRLRGVNLPLLTLFDFAGAAVEFPAPAPFAYRAYRSLDYKAVAELDYDTVFIDLDDCLIVEGKVNVTALAFLFQELNRGKRLVLVTRSAEAVRPVLGRFRVADLFDEVIHITDGGPKSRHLRAGAIFIDDSFAERQEVARSLGIPVFAPDALHFLTR
jgi:hypothetical protein